MHLPDPPLPDKVPIRKVAAERLRSSALLFLAVSIGLSAGSGQAYAQQTLPILLATSELPNGPTPQFPVQTPAGALTGTVVDSDGAAITNARITLRRTDTAAPQLPVPLSTLSGGDGSFTFTGLPAGTFQLIVIAAHFTTRQTTVTLSPGETSELPAITMSSGTSIDVEVTASQEEVAQAQIEEQEKQRVFGVIPNFFVSYAPHPLPINTRQKFELSLRSSLDPTAFAAAAFVAGIQQADNAYASWGQGMEGYGKRVGAAYGNVFIGTMLSSAILPAILKQDPRFFYKEGTVRERIKYSFAMAVLCKGDNGHWQFNYSGILGSAAAAGLSNLYYPAANRQGAWLTVGNTALGVAGSVVSNVFQEFLLPRLTPHKPQPNQTQP